MMSRAEPVRVSSQVLLQPQFIKAESVLLTTLKHDPCMVTTVTSPTTLATTTPVQSTSLQVSSSPATNTGFTQPDPMHPYLEKEIRK